MTDRQPLPATLDTVQTLTTVARFLYDHFLGDDLLKKVQRAGALWGEEARHEALAEGTAAMVDEVLGLLELGGALMDDRLGAVHEAIFAWVERDTGRGDDEGSDTEKSP
jgi:hypothetical protein